MIGYSLRTPAAIQRAWETPRDGGVIDTGFASIASRFLSESARVMRRVEQVMLLNTFIHFVMLIELEIEIVIEIEIER